MTISDRISLICNNKKVKQSELVSLGCGSKQTVNLIIHGKQKPNADFIETFLKAYPDIDARWLLTGEEPESKVEESRINYGFCKECLKKEGIIEYQKNEIALKQKEIEGLQKKVDELGERSRQSDSKAS